MPALGRSSLVLPLSVLINRNISSCSCGFFERDMIARERGSPLEIISRPPAEPGRGRWRCSSSSSSPASSQTSPWSAPSAGPTHSGSPKKKCGNVQTTSRVATLYHHDPKCMPALSTYFVFNIWDPGTSWFVMRFFTCSPAPWPPPSTIVLVTLFSISENREG